MESILRELYYGNLTPSEKFVTSLEEYHQLQDTQFRQHNAFFQSLDPYQKSLSEISIGVYN